MRNYVFDKRTKYFNPRLFATAALALLATAMIARADDPKPADKVEDPPKKKWETVATLGATLTRGNSKNVLVSGAIGTKRSWTSDEALFGASAGYGENTTTTTLGRQVDTTTDSYIRGFGQYNHFFTQQTYAGLRVSGEHDDVAALTYRLTVSPLAGYYFVKQTNAALAGEVGPSYVDEKFFSQSADQYLGLRIGERGHYDFKSGAKIWESVEWIPKIQDLQNYLVNAEAGVSALISKAFSVSVVLTETYKSEPAEGKQQNDLKLIAGLSYTF